MCVYVCVPLQIHTQSLYMIDLEITTKKIIYYNCMKLMIIQVKICYVCVCETKCLTSHVAPVLSLYVTVPHVRMNTVISDNCTIRSLRLTSPLGVWA